MFEHVQLGPADPMFDLKKLADGDNSPTKVDLGVGIYRNEEGQYHELEAVKQAKKILEEQNPGHDYESTTGNPIFLEKSMAVMFGEEWAASNSGRVASVQTISGTGANHLAALFLSRCGSSKDSKVYLGTPTWGNYESLCSLVGMETVKYPYYDPSSCKVNFECLLETVFCAAPGSIFILQGCCHNPVGVDLTPSQWQRLAKAMKNARVFPFFDIAYQGLGGSLDDDACAIRLFAGLGFEMIVCQSFSKNFGLYGERCGVLHVVCHTSETSARVYDQLRCLIRWEFSSSPIYGSRLATIIMNSEELSELWHVNLTPQDFSSLTACRFGGLSHMRRRLQDNRKALHDALNKTPGNWSMILATKGLFCCLPLSPIQCNTLRTQHQVYLPDNGRINVSGLNSSNIARVASAIASVMQNQQPHL